MILEEVLSRHKVIALQFSGGKDSLTCLYLLKEFWDKIYIVWVNTGACYQETISQMEKIRKLAPHFIEVVSNQNQWIEDNGLPSDLVPIPNSTTGRQLRNMPVKIQSWINCCGANLWKPMQDKMNELGVSLIIRGQKNSDYRSAPIKSGHVENGIEYYFPIEDWTNDDCFQFLSEKNVEIPSFYQWADTSLDCWNCTACLDERQRELKNMKSLFPEKWQVVNCRLELIKESVKPEVSLLMDTLYG